MNMSTLCTSLHRACIIALTTIVANPTAQAADTTRTLACQGEVKISTDNGGWQQPVSQGIIVNFAQQTVEGFVVTATFTITDRVTLEFIGIRDDAKLSVRGAIDRLTGDVWAIVREGGRDERYSLKCKPTKQMF